MPNYRGDYSGICWFFTVVAHQRRLLLSQDAAWTALRTAVIECRRHYPVEIDGWVLLPEFLHGI